MNKILPGVLNTNTNDKKRKSIKDVNKTRFDNRAIPDEIAWGIDSVLLIVLKYIFYYGQMSSCFSLGHDNLIFATCRLSSEIYSYRYLAEIKTRAWIKSNSVTKSVIGKIWLHRDWLCLRQKSANINPSDNPIVPRVKNSHFDLRSFSFFIW